MFYVQTCSSNNNVEIYVKFFLLVKDMRQKHQLTTHWGALKTQKSNRKYRGIEIKIIEFKKLIYYQQICGLRPFKFKN